MPALGHRGFAMNQLSAPPTVWAEIHRDQRTTPAYRRVLAHRWRLEQELPVRHINVFRFLRPALECLAAGEVLGLAFDGGGGKRWARVEFLGRQANVSVQSVQLAKKTGAVLLPTRVGRAPGETMHRIEIHAPIDLGDEQATLQEIADQFTVWIREQPEQYLPFLVVRRQMASLDVQPFFADYPEQPQEGGPEAAAARLRAAAERAGVAGPS
jgi:KDO2-lipid IV(A) lauroyltransferase